MRLSSRTASLSLGSTHPTLRWPMSSPLPKLWPAMPDSACGLPDVCGSATGSEMRIVHVEADAPGNDGENLNGEWVDIENMGTQLVDLTGWIVKDESASHRYGSQMGLFLPRALL